MRKLVLDFDGTLVDCSRRDYHLYFDIMTKIERPTLTFAEYWPMRRRPMNIRELIALTAPDHVDEFLQLRREWCELEHYLHFDRPFSDTFQALSELGNHFELHLVSARFYQENLLQEIKMLGMAKFLNGVIANKSHDKREAIQSLGDVFAVIGDAEPDIEAAKALNIKAIGVATGIRSREFLQSLSPDHVVDTLTEVVSTITAC